MTKHKRCRPKRRRAGCLMCKPWKAKLTPKAERYTQSDRRKLEAHRVDYAMEVPR